MAAFSRSGRRRRGAVLGHALPRREAFLAAGADAGQRRGEVGEAVEVVDRAEVVDVADDRARAGGQRGVAVEAQERVERDQTPAALAMWRSGWCWRIRRGCGASAIY
jgi:hypothetical protein